MSTSKEQIIIDRRYAAVLSSISDQSLAAMATALPDKLRDELAKAAGLKAGAFGEVDDLGAKIRTGFTNRKSYLHVGILLSEPCTEHCIESLGAAADDPNIEHLRSTLPAAIEKFGLDATRLMAIQYSASLNGFKQLLIQDQRFVIPNNATSLASPQVTNQTTSTPIDQAKKKLRRERQEKLREAKRQTDLQRKIARNRA